MLTHNSVIVLSNTFEKIPDDVYSIKLKNFYTVYDAPSVLILRSLRS